MKNGKLEYAPQQSNSPDISREKQAIHEPDDAPNDALSDNSPLFGALAALVSKLLPEQRAALATMLRGEG